MNSSTNLLFLSLYFVGLLISYHWRIEEPAPYIYFLIPLFMFFYGKFYSHKITLMLLIFLLGFLYGWYENNQYEKSIRSLITPSQIKIATLVSYPETYQKKKRVLTKYFIEDERGGKVLVYHQNAPQWLMIGDKIKIDGNYSIKANHPNRKIPGFYNYLKSKKVAGSLFLPHKKTIVWEGVDYRYLLHRFFQISRESIKESIGNKNETKKILSGLLLGEKTSLTFEEKNKYSRLGIIHYFAISGFHVGVVCSSFYFILLLLRISFQRKIQFTILFAIFYSQFIGNYISIERAVFMFSFFALAWLWGRPQKIENIWLMTGWCFLIFNPFLVLSVSFQLSFLSVWMICLTMKFQKRINGGYKVLLPLLISCFVYLGIFPLISFYFQMISPLSFMTSLIFGPIFSMLLMTGYMNVLFLSPILNLGELLFTPTLILSMEIFMGWMEKIPPLWGFEYKAGLLELALYYLSLFCISYHFMTLKD